MKRTALAVAAATVLLLLAGCTSTPASEPAPVASSSAAPAENATAEPLAAQTPEATEDTAEATFVADVRAKLRPDNVIPDATDAQLIAAGEKACEQIASGTPTDQISVIEGEELTAGYYRDSVQIVQAAATTIC